MCKICWIALTTFMSPQNPDINVDTTTLYELMAWG